MFHRTTPGLGILVFALVTTAAVAQIPCTESWDPNLSPVSGPNGTVVAADTFDVGSGPEFFIAGSFTRVAGLPAACCAKFDGTSWSGVGTAQSPGAVLKNATAMTVYDSGSGPKLHVAGLFMVPAVPVAAWHVARWDGAAWTLLGAAANLPIKALQAFYGGSSPVLVAAGQFTSIGGAAASFVARWNGSSWGAMGVNLPTVFVWTQANVLTVADLGSGPVLYAGGVVNFGPIGAVAQWGGSDWYHSGTSGLGNCSALAPWPDCPGGPTLVAAGTYPFISAVHPNVVETWNGSSWTHLGYSGPATVAYLPVVHALRAFDDGGGTALYVGGSMISIGSAPTATGMVPVTGVARFHNGTWSAAASLASGVQTFGLRQLPGITRLVVGGSFLHTGPYDPRPEHLAQWTGSEWTGLTSGMTVSSRVDAMTLFDDGGGTRLYAAGNFHTIGSAVANGLARWNGSAWEGLGSASLQPLKIQTMTGFDDGTGPRLYVAGTGPYGQTGLNIARWNGGTSFTPFGFGVYGDIRSLAVWDDGTGPHLWAAGYITMWESTSTSAVGVHLIRWNGTTWQSFSEVSGQPNPTNHVQQLLVEPGPGGGLVLTGSFTAVGWHSAGGIARIRPGYVVDALGGSVNGATTAGSATIHDEGNGPRIWVVTGASTLENLVYSYGEPGWTLRRTVGPNAGTAFLRSVPFQGERALYMGGWIQVPGPTACYLDRLAYQSWSPVAFFEGKPTDLIGWDDGNGFGPFVCGDFRTVAGVPSGGIGHLVQPWPTILTQPASQSVALGQPVVLQASAAGTPPLSHQWTHNSVPVPGATSSTLTIPAATYADAGYYAVDVSNACAQFTSRTATVSIGVCQLDVAQAFGPGVLTVSLTSGPPSAHAFTAFSLLIANAENPGTGAVFGLHLPMPDAIGQFVTQSQPFVTTLSPSGSSLWAAPVPPTLLGATVWGVSAIYDPATLTVLGSPSNISHQFLQ